MTLQKSKSSPTVSPPTEPVSVKKTIKNKDVCSKAHPPEPCKEGFYPKPPKNCCYKKTNKKKGGKNKFKKTIKKRYKFKHKFY